MKRLADTIGPVTSRSFERKYIALGRIVKSWPDIMGEKLAGRAAPSRLLYRRPKDKSRKPTAILEIAVSSAEATAMHYQKDLILERLNRLFGDEWVADIKFVPAPGRMSEKKPRIKSRQAPLTEDQKKSLSLLLEKIEDPDILARLDTLGQHIMRKDQTV